MTPVSTSLANYSRWRWRAISKRWIILHVLTSNVLLHSEKGRNRTSTFLAVATNSIEFELREWDNDGVTMNHSRASMEPTCRNVLMTCESNSLSHSISQHMLLIPYLDDGLFGDIHKCKLVGIFGGNVAVSVHIHIANSPGSLFA